MTSTSQKKRLEAAQVTPIEPILEPTPTLDKNSWYLDLFNGSGIAGAAATAAAKLTTLGYIQIKTGNVESSSYVDTHVYLASDVKKLSDLFLEDIKSSFPTATISGELTGSTASARIIIGR